MRSLHQRHPSWEVRSCNENDSQYHYRPSRGRRSTAMTRRLLAALLLVAEAAVAHASDLAIETTAEHGIAIEHGKALTGDASPVEPAHFEAEVSYTPLWNGSLVSSAASTHAWSMTLVYGLLPDFDVKLGTSFATMHDQGPSGLDGVRPLQ